MIEWTARGGRPDADLICFPELAVTGYPPEDLVLRPTFVRDNLAALERLAASTAGSSCAVMVGSSIAPIVDCTTPPRCFEMARSRSAITSPAPELRRVRREALLRPGTPRARSGRRRSSASRCARTRGTATRRSTTMRCSRPRAPQHQRLAVPPRQGRRTARDRPRPRASDRLVVRLRERRRRPGRARVRRGSMVVAPEGHLVARVAMFTKTCCSSTCPKSRRAALRRRRAPVWPDRSPRWSTERSCSGSRYVSKNGFREV